jgi:hypothetical protein
MSSTGREDAIAIYVSIPTDCYRGQVETLLLICPLTKRQSFRMIGSQELIISHRRLIVTEEAFSAIHIQLVVMKHKAEQVKMVGNEEDVKVHRKKTAMCSS